ncbi:uncharacterized protein BROUX77_003499 [Berkeleyomyces rouxiae]|uniref:uncharacterized protein n=1 Tax=Berkeleyomyces rouxiae TaxID=2035830 RepID=UPI003B82B9A0
MDPNYENESKGGPVVPAVASLTAVSTVFVALRLYTRVALSHSVSWDDLVTIIAYLITLAEGVVMIVHVEHGQGSHWDTLSPSEQVTYLQIFYTTLVLYTLALGVIKTAIMLQYLRIFTGKLRKVTIICMIMIGIWSAVVFLLSAFSCSPVRAFWDKTIDGKCLPNQPVWYASAAGNILTDLVIAILPIRTLWKLHLPKSQRLSLIGVFALGFFTCAISLIRVSALSVESDISFKNTTSAIWSFAELSCALITSSLPTIRPILYRILPRLFHPLTRSSNKKSNQGPEYAGYGVKSAPSMPEDESPLTKPPGTSTDKLSAHSSDIELQEDVGGSRTKDSTHRIVIDGVKPKKLMNLLPSDHQSCFTTISVGQTVIKQDSRI